MEMMHRDEGDEECESGKQENRYDGQMEQIGGIPRGSLDHFS
jgi:hypothetical protein